MNESHGNGSYLTSGAATEGEACAAPETLSLEPLALRVAPGRGLEGPTLAGVGVTPVAPAPASTTHHGGNRS